VRRQPQEGAPVTVVWLGAREAGTIERVEEEGRRVVVVTESAEVVEFVLGGKGVFVTADNAARLVLGP
jgi:hypothetical protein